MIGIVVEGESDRKIVEAIIKKERINIAIFKAKGKNKIISNWEFFMEKLKHYDRKIVLFDSDGGKTEKEIKEARKEGKITVPKNVKICYAVQKIESWLLGCFDVKNPDSITDPEQEIKKKLKAEKGAKASYNKTVDGPDIANKNKLPHFKNSMSFKKFYEAITQN